MVPLEPSNQDFMGRGLGVSADSIGHYLSCYHGSWKCTPKDLWCSQPSILNSSFSRIWQATIMLVEHLTSDLWEDLSYEKMAVPQGRATWWIFRENASIFLVQNCLSVVHHSGLTMLLTPTLVSKLCVVWRMGSFARTRWVIVSTRWARTFPLRDLLEDLIPSVGLVGSFSQYSLDR